MASSSFFLVSVYTYSLVYLECSLALFTRSDSNYSLGNSLLQYFGKKLPWHTNIKHLSFRSIHCTLAFSWKFSSILPNVDFYIQLHTKMQMKRCTLSFRDFHVILWRWCLHLIISLFILTKSEGFLELQNEFLSPFCYNLVKILITENNRCFWGYYPRWPLCTKTLRKIFNQGTQCTFFRD